MVVGERHSGSFVGGLVQATMVVVFFFYYIVGSEGSVIFVGDDGAVLGTWG